MSTPLPAQLYCALIPIGADTLLLPNSLIAETLGQDALVPAPEGSPAWLAGHLPRGGERLSVVRFEALKGGDAAHAARRVRLVVLHPLQGQQGAPPTQPLVLLAHGYPHLITLTPSALSPLPLAADDPTASVLARVKVGNGTALVPDLDQLQALVGTHRDSL